MTLKEKIENIIYDYVRSEYDRRDVCNALVVDVDDYAIEFAEWLNETESYFASEDQYHYHRTWHNCSKMLEIFKKEKGL